MATSTLSDPHSANRLLVLYVQVFLWYLLGCWVLWVIGVEGIYGHPMPFYGLIMPVFTLEFWPWHGLALVYLGASIAALIFAQGKWNLFSDERDSRATRFFLAALVFHAFIFAAVIAMVRGGPHGIVQAFDRQAYEYISDIGVGLSIRGLFSSYEDVHQHLSMHSKVHPPGPIAIFWMMSYVVGRTPMGLSLGTMAFGALSVLPFYGWVTDMFGKRVGSMSAVLFTLIPSIVLFTATSADITFMPFTLTTLWLFWRAITRGSIRYALAAGVGYACMSLISFSLVGIGIFFGLVGLWKLCSPDGRTAVFKTAGGMVLALGLVHFVVWKWSGMDIVHVFELSKGQFDTDQANLDLYDPRYPAWTWKIFNPLGWFYYAGIPLSVLCIKRCLKRPADGTPVFLIFALTLVVLDILYLARGEGERSAMYIMPFVAVPAGHMLNTLTESSQSLRPLWYTAAFLGLQCWLTEAVLYTYW